MCLLTESCHQLRQCLTLLLLLALLLWYCSWTRSLSHGWFLGWWWRSVMVCFYNFYMVEKPSGAAFLCPLLLHTRGLSDSLSPLEATCVTTWNEGTAASWLACYFQWLSLTTGVNLLNLGNTYCLPRMRFDFFLVSEAVKQLAQSTGGTSPCEDLKNTVRFQKGVKNDPISQKICGVKTQRLVCKLFWNAAVKHSWSLIWVENLHAHLGSWVLLFLWKASL